MAGSKEPNEPYKYNVQPFISPDDLEGTPFWQMIRHDEDMKASYDWQGNEVVIATPGRAGTHMAWNMVRYLLQGNTKPLPDVMTESYYPPYLRPEGSPQTGPRRVLGCQIIPCQFTGEKFRKTGNRKFIYIIRNPHDTAVSHYNVFKDYEIKCLPKEFPEFYNQYITGTAVTYPFTGWFTHVKAWEEYAAKNPDVPIMFQLYEDLVRKPRESMIEIAKFLDVEVTDAFLDDLVEASKFSNMRKNKLDATFEEQFKDDGNKSVYRKGEIGAWKNWLTVQNYELFQKLFAEQSTDLACKDRLVFT